MGIMENAERETRDAESCFNEIKSTWRLLVGEHPSGNCSQGEGGEWSAWLIVCKKSDGWFTENRAYRGKSPR